MRSQAIRLSTIIIILAAGILYLSYSRTASSEQAHLQSQTASSGDPVAARNVVDTTEIAPQPRTPGYDDFDTLPAPTAAAALTGAVIIEVEPPAAVGPTATPTRITNPTPTTLPTENPRPPITPRPTATSTPTPTPTLLPVATTIVLSPTAVAQASEIEYVVIISIDGLRPDALEMAFTPTLDNLRKNGSYCPHAQTVSLSVTLPSHASMLSGMHQDKHGITFSRPYIGWPGMSGPTVFSVASDAGLRTGMVFGKNKLSYIALPGSVHEIFSEDAHDPEVKDQAIKVIEEGMPHILFIHLPDTDRVGHEYGWVSENQLHAITFADSMIGEIVGAIEQGGYLDKTLLIVTSDHGGRGTGHGDDSPEDRIIPWLASGPGVRQDYTVTSPINTFDTAATALYALDLPIPEVWDGKPVEEAFSRK